MVDMKRQTTTRSELDGRLRRFVAVLEADAGLDIEANAAGWLMEPSALREKFFALGESVSAPDRGRGERVRIPVGWIWGPARLDDQQAADMIAAHIRTIPGVEVLSTPARDTQIGLAWAVDITIRISQ